VDLHSKQQVRSTIRDGVAPFLPFGAGAEEVSLPPVELLA
jgi:hypothetical protein